MVRGIAYERKGQDDLAMADYNLALQKRPTYGVRLQQPRHALSCARARCKARSTISTPRSNTRRTITRHDQSRARADLNKDFDGALADFAEASRIDPNAAHRRASTAA